MLNKSDFERWQVISGHANLPLYTVHPIDPSWYLTLIIQVPLQTHLRWNKS